MSETKFTKEVWAWQKFGGQYMLTIQSGMREIVLGTCRDRINTLVNSVATNVNGVLEPVTPEHPRMKLIASAPKLLQALTEAKEMLIAKGYTEESTGLAGINMVIKEATE